MKVSEIRDKISNEFSNPYCLLYSSPEVVFNRWDEIVCTADENQTDYFEVHVFDADKEYRWLQSILTAEGIEHWVIEQQCDGSIYLKNSDCEEKMECHYFDDAMQSIPLKSGLSIRVRNYFTFDENGMMKLCDYRLVGGK